MFYLLKRFKGGISYSEFYEAWDDDIWALYKKDTKLAEEEAKDIPNTNSGNTSTNGNTIKKIPEPEAPEEDENALALLREFRED